MSVVPLYEIIQFVYHSPLEGYLGYFQFGAILSRPTHSGIFMDMYINFPTQGVETLGPRIGVCMIFVFSIAKKSVPIGRAILPAMFQSSGCSTFSPKFGVFSLFSFSHCGGCVVSHCGDD